MRLVLFALAVIAVAILIYAVWQAIAAVRDRRAPWRIEERSEGERVVVYLVRPQRQPLRVGAVEVAAEDFDEQIAELRAAAGSRRAVLNAGR